MKKIAIITVCFFILITLVFIAIASRAEAQTWHRLNQGTLQWDHDGLLSNGDPITSADTVFFRVYMKEGEAGAPTIIADYLPSTGAGTYQHIITVDQEGQFYSGIQAVRWIGGDSGREYVSATSWSYDPAVVNNGETWGIDSYYGPSGATSFQYANTP